MYRECNVGKDVSQTTFAADEKISRKSNFDTVYRIVQPYGPVYRTILHQPIAISVNLDHEQGPHAMTCIQQVSRQERQAVLRNPPPQQQSIFWQPNNQTQTTFTSLPQFSVRPSSCTTYLCQKGYPFSATFSFPAISTMGKKLNASATIIIVLVCCICLVVLIAAVGRHYYGETNDTDANYQAPPEQAEYMRQVKQRNVNSILPLHHQRPHPASEKPSLQSHSNLTDISDI